MDQILVTGYNGFVGSHLVDMLAKDYQIIGLSNKKPVKKNFFR